MRGVCVCALRCVAVWCVVYVVEWQWQWQWKRQWQRQRQWQWPVAAAANRQWLRPERPIPKPGPYVPPPPLPPSPLSSQVPRCLDFVRAHINEIIKLPIDLNCLNDGLVGRLAALFEDVKDLAVVKDERDKVRYWQNMKREEFVKNRSETMKHEAWKHETFHTLKV